MRQRSRALAAAVLLAAFLAAYNNVVHLLPGHAALYVPLNLVVAAALVALSRWQGWSWTALGLSPAAAPAGLAWGGAVAGAVTVGFAAVLASPARDLLVDQRFADLGAGELAYQALVRIPFGTVVLEEVAFRGVLLAAVAHARSVPLAVAVSSTCFGLWHVRPTLSALAANDVATSGPSRWLAVTAAVVVTGLAGVGFCWLRLRSRSLLAPMLGHTATNSLGAVAAFLSHRWA